MRKIIIAVGSTRRPKLNAVSDALAIFGTLLAPDATFEIAGVEVPSGVRHTPLSRADMMAGARHRAEALHAMAVSQQNSWNYFVGLEGGLDITEQDGRRWVFLENWAYVLDSSGRNSYGQSGA